MPKAPEDRVRPVSPKEYSEAFEVGAEQGEGKDSKQKKAHALALDIRKFEIELYWKRAGFFWTFIAATLAGFMVVQSKSEYLSVVLACVGLVFSFAWYCANRGSKHWQENCENHVDLLEDAMVGPLYKIVTLRPLFATPWWKPKGLYVRLKVVVTGPTAFSMSKINQIVSLFVIGLWIALLIEVLPPFTWNWRTVEWKYATPVGLAIFSWLLILSWGRSDAENYKGIRATRRDTTIKEHGG